MYSAARVLGYPPPWSANVNAACGAAGIHRRHFMFGTILVMLPTLVLMALAVSWFPALAGWFLDA